MQPTTPATPATRQEAFIAEMTQRMATVAGHLSRWATGEARTLGEVEQEALRLVKELGNALVAGACQLAAPATAAPSTRCACGQRAA